MTGFTFEIRKGVPIPEDARAETANAHTFPWSSLGDGDGFEVPKKYWEERGVEKFTQQKARERIRGHFKQWQGKDSTDYPKADREKRLLIVRNGRDGAVEVWVKFAEEAAASEPAVSGEPKATTPAKGKKAA